MIKEIDNTPDSDWGIVTSKNLKVAEGKQRSWVVDNFYENPDQVRKYALGTFCIDKFKLTFANLNLFYDVFTTTIRIR